MFRFFFLFFFILFGCFARYEGLFDHYLLVDSFLSSSIHPQDGSLQARSADASSLDGELRKVLLSEESAKQAMEQVKRCLALGEKEQESGEKH